MSKRFVVSPRQLEAAIARLARKASHNCLDCDKPIDRQSNRGPRPRRCPHCAYMRKGRMDRTRVRSSGKPKSGLPPCCAETGRICPQHQQARKSDYDHAAYNRDVPRKEVARLFEVLGQGYQVQTVSKH